MSAYGQHGQKKIPTTADALALKVEREHGKIVAYQELCQVASDLRAHSKLDNESLQVTTTLLTQNPEFYTIWNFRRDILVHMHKEIEPDQVQTDCEIELRLTEQLLQGAPKSYWVWNHRRWTLQHMPNPSWERELKLLDYMLDLDARNFHGWDYRRYVVAEIKTRKPQQEFEYTLNKINQNFSNYSAWHYRSKLFPWIFIDPKSCNTAISQDLEIVRNAVFTEPADQSAWLYQRWLLGKDAIPLSIVCAFMVPGVGNAKNCILAILFNQEAKLNQSTLPFAFTINGKVHHAHIKTPTYGRLHILDLGTLINEKSILNMVIDSGRFSGNRLDLNSSTTTIHGTMGSKTTWMNVMLCEQSVSTQMMQSNSVWQEELSFIEQLSEIEPDSKWPLLTLVYIYEHVDSAKHAKSASKILNRLAEIDPLRTNYYRDWRSRFVWADYVDSIGAHVVDSDKSVSEAHFQTKVSRHPMNLGLSVIPNTTPLLLVTNLNLSGNCLCSLDFALSLLLIEKLIVDDNSIKSLPKTLHNLVRLESISLQRNCISSASDAEGVKQHPTLKEIHLQGNPISDSDISNIQGWLSCYRA
ncbi:hypothetical protein MT418_001333 [Batrachochytrium dendrobatidis]